MTEFERVQEENKQDSKTRIIEVASVLFSERGFEGASIRELSRLAEVNISAINYYFSSKENLYLEVIKQAIESFRVNIGTLYRLREWSTENFLIALYEMLIRSGPVLINNFKVFLSSVPIPEDLISLHEMPGPPGVEYLLASLERDHGGPIDEELAAWAVSVLFTYVIHTALMASTPMGQKSACDAFVPEKVQRRIAQTVQSVLSTLCSSAKVALQN